MSIEYTECIVCKKPLGQDSRDQGFPTCHTHRTCTICNKIVSARHLQIIVSQTLQHDDTVTPDLIVHNDCAIQQLAKSGSGNGNIPITLAELDQLNLFRLCFTGDISLSEDANTKIADSSTSQLFKDKSLEEKFLTLRKIQAVAARLSIILGSSRDKIKKELEERNKKEYEEIQKIRKHTEDTTKQPSTNTYGFSQKVWDNMSKVDKKRIRNREKFIEDMVKLSIPRDSALAMWNKQHGKEATATSGE